MIEGAILVVLLVLSGFFSGIELAFFSLSAIQVREMRHKGRHGAELVETLKKDPQKLLITILIGNNLVNIGAASFATVVAMELFGNNGVGIATGAMTFLVLIFGEITPKAFCSKYAEKIALRTAPLVYVLLWLLTPISIPLGWGVRLLTGHDIDTPLVTDETMKRLAQIGMEEGTVEESESELIHNTFRLHDLTAKDLCVPLSQSMMVNGDDSMEHIRQRMLQMPYSRMPVYRKRIDNVIGIIHRDDYLVSLVEEQEDDEITTIMRMPHFCQSNINAQVLLRKMQALRTHLWIVKEQGVSIGLITMEDILEELVGDILDETDLEEQLLRRLSKNEILALGRSQVVDINNYFNIRLKSNDTLETYLKSLFDKTPRKGDSIRLDDLTFDIVEAERGKIKIVRIRREEE